jgi:hypothetical protein
MEPNRLLRVAVVSAVTLVLAPVVQGASTQSARDLIVATHAAHLTDLPEALESGATLRANYVDAHLQLARLSSGAAKLK